MIFRHSQGSNYLPHNFLRRMVFQKDVLWSFPAILWLISFLSSGFLPPLKLHYTVSLTSLDIWSSIYDFHLLTTHCFLLLRFNFALWILISLLIIHWFSYYSLLFSPVHLKELYYFLSNYLLNYWRFHIFNSITIQLVFIPQLSMRIVHTFFGVL